MANDWDNFDIPEEIEIDSNNNLWFLRNFSMSENILQSNKGSVKLADKAAFNLSSRSCGSDKNIFNAKKNLSGINRWKKKYSKFAKNRKNWSSIVTKRNKMTRNDVVLASRNKIRNRSDSVSPCSSDSQKNYKSSNLNIWFKNNMN